MNVNRIHANRFSFSVTTSLGTLNLFSLAVPFFIENILNNLPGTVNTMILSAYSATAVAAVGAANQVLLMFNLLFTAICLGATVVICNYIGAEKVRESREAAFTVIAMCLTVSAVLSPCLWILSPHILALLNLTGEIYAQALLYFRIQTFFVPVTAATTAILSIWKCYGYPKLTVIIGVVTNALNLLLNVIVVYFPQYAPVQGVAGVALSRGISQVLGLMLAIVFLIKIRIRMVRPKKFRAVLTYGINILKIGIPTGISSAMYTLAGTVSTGFMALIGDYALTANVYFTSILSYAYLFSSGFGNANAILIGRLYGAEEYDRASAFNRQLVKITVPVNLLISLLILLLRRQILSLFTADPVIIALALAVFSIDLIAEQARAVSQVYEYALRAAGDVTFSAITFSLSCWVLSIGLAYVLALPCQMGLAGCWLGIAADEVFRAVVCFFRWKSGVWKKRKIAV